MIKKLLFLPGLLFLAVVTTNAQNHLIDSLKNKLDTITSDTSQLKTIIDISIEYADIDLNKAEYYLNKADSLKEVIDHPKFDALTYQNLGSYYFKTSKYDKALEYFNKALPIYRDLDLEIKAGSCLNNMGIIYEKKSNYDKALEFLLQALKIWEKHNAEYELAKVYLNIGLIHFRNENYDKANEYYNKSLKIRKEIDDKQGIALVYNNLAILYYYQGKYDYVRDYFEKAYNIYQELGNLRKQTMALSNLGKIYFEIGKYDKALNAYKECAAIEKNLEEKSGLVSSYTMMAEVYKARKQYDKSVSYLNKALAIAKEIEAKDEIKDIYYELSMNYKAKNNYKVGLKWFEMYSALNDSLFNATKNKQINELQTKYETEKKERKIELLNKEKKLRDLQLKRQKNFVIFLTIIVVVVLIFAIIVLIQKKKLSRAHYKLAKQQKQITDSIEYASLIQNAILPNHQQLNDVLNQEYFIFFRPKEVVSGDFYFVDEKSGKKIIAAVDCTGHGVPGAFMSMLGYSFLVEIVNNTDEFKANRILNKLREYIIRALHQKQEIGYSKDGLDISLCIVDEKKQKLEFAGAYQYMFLLRDKQITRYSGDKMPVGIHYKRKGEFSLKEIDYKKGDIVYLFSDGYPDQFGGENGKKFRLGNFRDLLLTIHDEDLITQKDMIEKTLDNWMGNCEQVDDILVMGIRL